MSMNDALAAALSKILNAEKIGKAECYVKFPSTVLKSILRIMNEKKYIGDFSEIKDSKGNLLKINLLGNINKCCVIKPRYPVKVKDLEKFEKRFLPAQNFGYLLMSTPFGIINHHEAKKKNTGGKLLAYIY